MYSAGLNSPTGEGETELLGNLSLVGVKGSFCAILSDRELTLERSDGKGLRLSLAAVNRTRHLTIPLLPNGLVPIGIIAIILGLSTISFPYGLIPISLGFLAISFNIFSRYPIISIDTNSGDRHLIAGSEGSLLRLATMISRLIHGSSMVEARIGLENLEKEMPIFPAFTHAGGNFTKHSNKLLMNNNKIPEFSSDIRENTIQKSYSLNNTDENLEREEVNFNGIPVDDTLSDEKISPKSAYESAWNTPPPPWYKEKQRTHENNEDLTLSIDKNENRMDSVLSEAAGQLEMFGEGLDMFGQGGLFDQSLDSHNGDTFPTKDIENKHNVENKPIQISSSQMMKKAYETYGSPDFEYERSYELPRPNEEAVREECKTGIVQEARAKQEIKGRNRELQYSYESTNLDSYPSLKKYANQGNNHFFTIKNNPNSISSSLLNRLFRPSSISFKKTQSDSPSDNRFQTSQHLRLRSDQEHQSSTISRSRRRNKNIENDDAMKIIDMIVSGVSNDEKNQRRLNFKNMRKTTNSSENNKLLGIRKLG
ncbi:MAG: hypothetical protein CMB47_05025 [Euryarchaeota archaeon]|nr:hypothetical protein [Euryarchaeota archaeon]